MRYFFFCAKDNISKSEYQKLKKALRVEEKLKSSKRPIVCDTYANFLTVMNTEYSLEPFLQGTTKNKFIMQVFVSKRGDFRVLLMDPSRTGIRTCTTWKGYSFQLLSEFKDLSHKYNILYSFH